MEAIIKSGCPKLANLASASISLALVFGGGVAYAEGFTGFAASPLTALIGGFSQADLEQLDHASTNDATMARLAAMGATESAIARPRKSMDSRGRSASQVEADLFPHSGQLLPLLVVRPEASRVVAQSPAPGRPGVAQPVGVSRSRLRSIAQGDRNGL